MHGVAVPGQTRQPTPDSPRKERSFQVSGKWVLLALLVTACTVPVITWATLRRVEAVLAIDAPPLVWTDRATWPSPPIKRLTLERAESPGYYATGRWKPYDFSFSTPEVKAIEAEQRALKQSKPADFAAAQAALDARLTAENARVEAAVAECVAIARLADPALRTAGDASPVPASTFEDDAVRHRLEALTQQHPSLFYPHYLLGTWHRLHGDAAEADRHYSHAFALAPAVIKLRYRESTTAPAADLDAGSIEIGIDRVIPDDKTTPDVNENALDQNLKLVYPRLATDERGCIYLPTFHAVYRFAAWPEPAGHHARHYVEGWFQFPGRIGSPKPSVVWKR